MKISTAFHLSAIALSTIPQLNAASVSINGRITAPLKNSSGENLPDGSLVEIGYFLGVSITIPVGDYTTNNLWETFTVLRVSQTEKLFNFFDAGASLTGDAFDSDTDFDALPRRVGVRITDLVSGEYNIYTIDGVNSELEIAVGSLPDFNAGFADLSIDGSTANVVWLGTPFTTSVSAVPEPSTSLSALLGLSLLLGARRRK